MKRVIIATPSLTGQTDVSYTISLAETMIAGLQNQIHFMPLIVMRDALLQRVRDDLFALAYGVQGVDGMLWIDADMGWNPMDAVKLVNRDKHLIGTTARRKSDVESYVVNGTIDQLVQDSEGLMQPNGLGLAFFYMSRKAMEHAWKTGQRYKKEGQDRRWLFDVRPVNGDLQSEDMHFTKKMAKKFTLHLDPTINLNHAGYQGNFLAWVAAFLKAVEEEKAKAASAAPAKKPTKKHTKKK